MPLILFTLLTLVAMRQGFAAPPQDLAGHWEGAIDVPGQPVYDLVPEVGGEFSLKLLKVVRVRFLEDAKGNVTALEISQPGGVFEYKRSKG